MPTVLRSLAQLAPFALLLSGSLGAQGVQGAPADTGAAKPAQPAAAPAPARDAAPSLNFSGVIFGSYNYQLPTTPAQLRNQTNNSFVIDRAYLNFRMAAGDRTSIRITTDVFQSADSSSNAYTIRAKYAYLQYEGQKFSNGAAGDGADRHPAERDHRAHGQLLAALSGPGGDGACRLLLVGGRRASRGSSRCRTSWERCTPPWSMGPATSRGSATGSRTWPSDSRSRRWPACPPAHCSRPSRITAWGYKGATASSFVNGGTGQTGAVGEALDRSRAGVFVGIRDPRLVLGGELAQRHEGGETGLNTAASPRGTTETTGRMLSGFTVARPLAFFNASGKSSVGLVARYDHVRPTVSTTGFASPPATVQRLSLPGRRRVLGSLAEGAARAGLSGVARVEQRSVERASVARQGLLRAFRRELLMSGLVTHARHRLARDSARPFQRG